jgi:hypothetical protein
MASNGITFHFAWAYLGSGPTVYYHKASYSYGSYDYLFFQAADYKVISEGSGFTYNLEPSIIELNGGARVCWKGILSPSTYKTVFRDPAYSQFWNFGSSTVQSVNINRSSDGNYVIGWSQGSNPYSNHYVRNTTLSVVKNFGTTGRYIQINNGSSFNNMYAHSFNQTSVPYYFTKSNSVGSIGKESSDNFTYSGRKGVLWKDEAQFYFLIGDLSINGQNIEFVEKDDTIDVNNLEMLNKYLVTLPFELTDNSKFKYSIQYGTTDTARAISLLSGKNEINFKLQIIEENTGNVLSELNNVLFRKGKANQSDDISYEVNTGRTGSKTVRIKLAASSNFDVNCSLSKAYAADFVIAKSSLQNINLENESLPTTYDLAQNYPNPFNPTTMISYSLPKANHVTLKVYDLLGRVVALLVNEIKPQGRHNVQFNASSLASGIYFYRLQAGNFVETKKLVIAK